MRDPRATETNLLILRKNYFLVLLYLLIALPVYSQSPGKVPPDSVHQLAEAASGAYRTYDYNNAIEYSLKAIELASRNNDYDNLNRSYNLLGVTYEVLKDTLRARENYQKALEYARQTENDTVLWYAYNNLGNIYSSNKETINKGLEYYEKAIEVASALPDSEEALTPVVNIAWTHLENLNYEQAVPYLKKAWGVSRDFDDKKMQSTLLALYGMYHSERNEFPESRDHFEQAIAMAENDTLLVEASFAYEEFSKMLHKSGNFSEAYDALREHQAYKEMIFQEEKNFQRETVYGKFETEQYKKDLAAAQREQQFKDEVIEKSRQISIIMVISLLVMFGFLIILLRYNRIRKKLISEQKIKNKELQEAKEKAERLSLLKTRFFSTVSHELRTPLYGVVGLASLLLEDNKNKEQEEDLKSLKFSADYLLALINDVLQMNKMESNLVQLEDGAFDLEELMKDILKSFEFSRKQNQNVIDLEIAPDVPKKLIGDSMRLSQVLMNLVGNSVKFTERGKVWIKIHLLKSEDKDCLIHFEVGDTGIGIPQNKQKVIFEEFSQLRNSNYNYQGTGLGLPIVKKLLHLFNSEIHLESEEGRGSVFSFQILFKKETVSGVVADSGEERSEVNEKANRKILIVDDNRINQVVTRRILEKRSIECTVASSGEEALAYIRSQTFDLVLMDVNMPGMSGMETTVEIRKFNSHLPVIALTAVEVEEMREEILNAGMNDIIVKPYDIPQFFNAIYRNLLEPVA